MPVSKKLAIFDFDGTIYKYQSPDMFADFAGGKGLRSFGLQMVCTVLDRYFKQYWVKHKKLKLAKIKGYPLAKLQQKADEFVREHITGNLIEIVDKELEKYIRDPEFDVLIASAGYDIYLSKFAELRGIPFVAATHVAIQNNKATGKWIGADCYDYQKVGRIKELVNLANYDLPNSVCYSDSMSDKPIFDLVGHKFFVKRVGEEYVIKNI